MEHISWKLQCVLGRDSEEVFESVDVDYLYVFDICKWALIWKLVYSEGWRKVWKAGLHPACLQVLLYILILLL